MFFCYLDESGGAEPPDRGRDATPVMVILGLVVDAAKVPELTRDFLALKRRHFPGLFRAGHALDHIKVEIKGSEILQMTRSRSRDKRRQASRMRGELLDLVDAHGCRVLGRVWVKEQTTWNLPDLPRSRKVAARCPGGLGDLLAPVVGRRRACRLPG